VVYDGRGAISAEWKEYPVVNNQELIREIFALEKEVVLNSDYRISVSRKLVEYWRNEFNYFSKEHVIIPCTLNSIYEKVVISDETIASARKLVGMQRDDIVFLYSGSIAGWQSFNLLSGFMEPLLKSGTANKIIFLSDEDENIVKLKKAFPGQVFSIKVNQVNVPNYLLAADYGLLIREESVTNKVASPVKFAEYLACGLKVIISRNLGDYSDFVITNKCGYIAGDFHTEAIDKQALKAIAAASFTKAAHFKNYKNLVDFVMKKTAEGIK
jgi:glycosyltransferase involved in cell wall biosynthesis